MPSGKKRKRHKMATHKRKKRLRKNRHKHKKQSVTILVREIKPIRYLIGLIFFILMQIRIKKD